MFAANPIMVALRRAFTAEHGLQCGFCTPGLLITARDIVRRLPDADERRIRLELSGNLCRCTGYVGIVRAISRVLQEVRSGALAAAASEPRKLGPVGSGRADGIVHPPCHVTDLRPANRIVDAIVVAGSLLDQFRLAAEVDERDNGIPG